ncbi:MAG: CpsB/CapC family capsule biosynthesis tyrosine phosphatase, partial [Acidobacteriota bacterium]
VLCHPERNTEIQANISLLYEFVVAGALVQLDTGSIRGDFGSEPGSTANKLLKNNLVHVIASDCHDIKKRPPGLSKIKDHLRWMENEKIEMMINDVPAAIINNSGIPDIGPAKDPSASGSVFNIFRRKN